MWICLFRCHTSKQILTGLCSFERVPFPHLLLFSCFLNYFLGLWNERAQTLIKHESKVAVKDCTAAADTLEALDINSLSLTVNDCSIPISLVAHVVVSPQQALLSEREQMVGWIVKLRFPTSAVLSYWSPSPRIVDIFSWVLQFLRS